MNLPQQIARHFREIYFGGNWTSSNVQEHVADVTWQQATAKVYSFNTIAALVYHTNYYVSAVLQVLQGEPLQAKDTYSFDLPPIHSQDVWEALLDKVSFGKPLWMKNTGITTEIFTALLSIPIII
jgi:hypothetical protein